MAVGGATRNAFWMQNKADMLGRPLEVPAVTEASPLGAAILAGIGVGLYRDEQEAYAPRLPARQDVSAGCRGRPALCPLAVHSIVNFIRQHGPSAINYSRRI